MTGPYAAVLFPSVSATLRAEKVLKQAGLAVKVVPVPRHLSSDCGVCLRIAANSTATATLALEAARLQHDGIHNI